MEIGYRMTGAESEDGVAVPQAPTFEVERIGGLG